MDETGRKITKIAREAIDDKVGDDDQHKRQHQLSRDEFAANPQGRNDLVAGQAHVDQNAQRGKPLARLGIGACRTHEHNARDARRQLKRQLASGLDKATVHAADIEQRARDLIIEETAHAQTKAQDNRDHGDIFLIDVSEHAFLSMGSDCPNGAFAASTQLVVVARTQLLQQHECGRHGAGAVVGIETATQAAARTGARLIGHRQLAALGEVHRAVPILKLKGHLLGHVDAQKRDASAAERDALEPQALAADTDTRAVEQIESRQRQLAMRGLGLFLHLVDAL